SDHARVGLRIAYVGRRVTHISPRGPVHGPSGSRTWALRSRIWAIGVTYVAFKSRLPTHLVTYQAHWRHVPTPRNHVASVLGQSLIFQFTLPWSSVSVSSTFFIWAPT